VPLCREVLLESRYTTRISQIPKLQVSGQLAWNPDARLRGMEVVWRKDSEEISAPVEEVVSDNEGSRHLQSTLQPYTIGMLAVELPRTVHSRHLQSTLQPYTIGTASCRTRV
ncbi:hypothetical protein GBAR_LOCUS30265, partial [Geodia barretti]